MNNKIFVGGINWKTNEDGLEKVFTDIGQIVSVKIVYDRDTGRSRGFGFVEFSNADEADNAVKKCDGMEFEGRTIKVSIAKERPRGNSGRGNRGRGSGGRFQGGHGGGHGGMDQGGGGNRW